tara:strand:- start:701 stop:1573 length:873 start_codon:yes stop_codon:yes gene_type:complete
MRILTTILTSKEIDKFQRCLNSVISQTECLVICNTLDNDYAKQVEAICSTQPVRYIRTESTGWPSGGKQTVLDYFSKTDYDYLFLIEGDDFIYPNTLEILNVMVEKHHPIDIMALTNQEVLMGELMSMKDWRTSKLFDERMRPALEQLPLDTVRSFLENTQTAIDITGDGINRIVLYSKKGAQIKYDTNVKSADDFVFGCEARLLHEKGDITMYLTNCPELYIYDQNDKTGFAVPEKLAYIAKYMISDDFKRLTDTLGPDIIEISHRLTYDERKKYIKKTANSKTVFGTK